MSSYGRRALQYGARSFIGAAAAAGARRMFGGRGRRYFRRGIGSRRRPAAMPTRLKGYAGFRGQYGRTPEELKRKDSIQSGTLTTGIDILSQPCVDILQNATDEGRIGKSIIVKSVHLKGNIKLIPSTEVVCNCAIDLWCVLDKQANGAASPTTAIWNNIDGNKALRNFDNMSRFEVLVHRTYQLEPKAGVSGTYNNCFIDINIYKKLNIAIDYGGATGAITEIKSNNITWFVSGEGQTAQVNMDTQHRLSFTR